MYRYTAFATVKVNYKNLNPKLKLSQIKDPRLEGSHGFPLQIESIVKPSSEPSGRGRYLLVSRVRYPKYSLQTKLLVIIIIQGSVYKFNLLL